MRKFASLNFYGAFQNDILQEIRTNSTKLYDKYIKKYPAFRGKGRNTFPKDFFKMLFRGVFCLFFVVNILKMSGLVPLIVLAY